MAASRKMASQSLGVTSGIFSPSILERGAHVATDLTLDEPSDTNPQFQITSDPETLEAPVPHVSIPITENKVRTNQALPEAETHYILVVHGTFVKSGVAGKVSWHHPDPTTMENNFCAKLSALLVDGPLGREAVWRALPEKESLPEEVNFPFYWDGSNTHEGRLQGAHNLAKLLRHIGKNDPAARVHIVAHSHGGNVTLKAIEQYIQKLKPESASRHWPAAVCEQFTAAYNEEASQLANWRRVEGVSFWGALNPFLVVWRGPQGQKKSSESYPWGYHRLWDWCLGLGQRRTKKFLGHKRMTSPISNVLGKIVFLGTPFYYKHWAKQARFKLTLSLILTFVGIYLFSATACSIWVGISDGKHFNYRVVYRLAALLTVLLFAAHMATWCDRTLLRSGNMYHSNQVPWSPAMHALVVQAGKLDEAALALSAEPAARAYLLPLIKKATQALGWVPFPRRPRKGARLSNWAPYILACCRAIFINVLDLLPRSILWGVGKLVVVQTFGVLRKVVVGAAFGLNTENLSTASVYAGESLTLGGNERSIQNWDVGRILAEAEELSCAGIASLSRTAFGTGSEGSFMSSGSLNSGESNFSRSLGASRNGGRDLELEGIEVARSIKGQPCGSGVPCNETSRCAKHLQEGLAPGDVGMSKAFGDVDQSEESLGVSESDYAFLWDEEKLRQSSDASWMFKKLKKQLHKVNHSPLLSDAEFEREFRIICCVFEQRLAEIRGHFQLAHSTYYKNPYIVESIAQFLEKGVVLGKAL